MPIVDQLADFVQSASYEDLSDDAAQQLKIRVLDSLGCAIGALDGEPIRALQKHLADFGGTEQATLIGGGRRPTGRPSTTARSSATSTTTTATSQRERRATRATTSAR